MTWYLARISFGMFIFATMKFFGAGLWACEVFQMVEIDNDTFTPCMENEYFGWLFVFNVWKPSVIEVLVSNFSFTFLILYVRLDWPLIYSIKYIHVTIQTALRNMSIQCMNGDYARFNGCIRCCWMYFCFCFCFCFYQLCLWTRD